jgi:hypothetical protein
VLCQLSYRGGWGWARSQGAGLRHDLEDFELHGSARGFDLDGVTDVGLHEGQSHGAIGADGEDVAVGLGEGGFAHELDELLAVVVQVEEFDGVSDEDDVFGDIFVGDDGQIFEFGFEFGEFALDASVFLLGEVVFGIFGEVTEAGGFANAVLDVDLSFVELFAFGLEGGFFLGADELHGDLPIQKRQPPRLGRGGLVDSPGGYHIGRGGGNATFSGAFAGYAGLRGRSLAEAGADL